MNDSKEKLLNVMQKALIEIRFNSMSSTGNKEMIGTLADLFHNIPKRLISNEVDYTVILTELEEKARYNPILNEWLKHNI